MPLSDPVIQILSAFKPATERRELPVIEDDDFLFVPLTIGATYKIEAYVLVTTLDAVAGIQWQFGAPPHTGRVSVSEINANAGFNAGLDAGSALATIQSIIPAAGAETHLIFTGTIATTAAGVLVFRWGKAVATLGPTTAVERDSWLTAQRLIQ